MTEPNEKPVVPQQGVACPGQQCTGEVAGDGDELEVAPRPAFLGIRHLTGAEGAAKPALAQRRDAVSSDPPPLFQRLRDKRRSQVAGAPATVAGTCSFVQKVGFPRLSGDDARNGLKRRVSGRAP